MKKKNESIPLFSNPFLERLTHVNPLLPLLFWTPVILILFWRTFVLRSTPFSMALAMLIAGPLLWTLVEYTLHRFLFHFQAKGPLGARIVFIFHGIHHEDPQDATRLVMPLVPGILYGSLLYLLFCSLFGNHWGEGLLAFFFLGYLCYDYIHYSIHHFVPKTAVGRYLRRSHLIHHAHADFRFGVSSPLWDILLGTLNPPAKKDPSP